MTNIIAQAAHKAGVGDDWIEPMLQISAHESSFRPYVPNGSGSSAYGLFQMINGTWAKYGKGLDRNNPVDQAYAAIKYMKSKYGSAANAWKYWQQHRNY